MTEATSNAKQVFYLLVEFDQDYGCFPDDVTAVDALAECRGDYANDYLAQLFRAGYTTSEAIFYVRGGTKKDKRPDSVIQHKERLLEAGENGFAYIKGLDTSSNSGMPVLLSPMHQDGTRFSRDTDHHKAIVLRVDGAVKQMKIDRKTGEVQIGEGKTLFQSGADTVWGKEGFDLENLLYAK